MQRRILVLLVCTVTLPAPAVAQRAGRVREPIIDVHLHANLIGTSGAPGDTVCTDTEEFLSAEYGRPQANGSVTQRFRCRVRMFSASSDSVLMRRTIEILRRYNIYALTSGDLAPTWREAEPRRIWLDSHAEDTTKLRAALANGARALGEFGFQYSGLGPADSVPMSVFAFAAGNDLPIGVHVGPGPPGAPFIGMPSYRMRLSNPLQLEEVFSRYPTLRLYMMHAGWPMLNETIGMLYTYPQLYVDIGVLAWDLPRAEFYRYLRGLVDAGFTNRIMFGSDQMQWPDAIPASIRAIEQAPFLTQKQKRAIFYDNAARFLRLSEEEMRRHREGK